MRIVYLPLYADKEPFISHKKAQEKTCFAGNLDDVFWIAGSTSNNAYFNEEERLLSLPVGESFENIFSKSIIAFQWMLDNVEFDFLVRTNTSTYFDVYRITSLIDQMKSPEILAAGEFGYSSLNERNLINPSIFLAGTAVILSRSVVEQLVKCNQSEWNTWPDDVAISHILSTLEIKFEHVTRIDLTDYKPFKIGTHYRVKSWSDESATIKRFTAVYRILNSRKNLRFFEVTRFQTREFLMYTSEFPIHRGLNLVRWARQIARYIRLDKNTWLWIFGANV